MRYRSAVVFCLLIAGTAGAEPEDDLASRVVAMTGARTKIVWVHATDGRAGKNADVLSPDYELMTFDSADGKTRTLLPGPTMYACPWITPSGKQIVYTGEGDVVFAVNWDGKNRRQIASGVAYCVWADPKNGTEWVFIANRGYGDEVYRHRLDKPSVRKLVWRGPTSIRFRVSADGTRAGGEFSWPKAGVANLTDGTWKRYGSGCNSMIAPDNSYRFFHMGGAAGHGGVMMYDAGGTGKRVVRFRGMPGARAREASWIPKWSSDVRFLTINAPATGKRAEVYLGQFDPKFTRVDEWVRITNQPGQDAYAYAWIDPGLGQYFGEAPLTVTVPAKLTPGKWQWDYGDGKKEEADTGKHTYKAEGTYKITASKGKKVLRGWVNVQDRSGPTAVGARLLDQRHVLVTFNERVQLKSAEVSLGSGRKVKGFSLDPDGIELTVELVEPLTRIDVLVLRGVFDRSDNPMTRARVPVIPLPWPANRNGMVLLWGTARTPNICLDRAAEAFGPVDLSRYGVTSFDRLGAMRLAGGAFTATGAGAAIVRLCKKSDAFSIQATITPSVAEQGDQKTPARIIGCGRRGRSWQEANFALHQEGRMLVLYLRNKVEGTGDKYFGEVHRTVLCALTPDVPNHVMVSYTPGKLLCYLNGKRVMGADEPKGVLSWGSTDHRRGVHFGSAYAMRTFSLPWRGRLEGVVIYSRAVGAKEAAEDYAQYARKLKARKPVPRIEVKVKLAARSDVPDAAAIAPYRSAMVVCEYVVAKVLKGKYPDKKIRVARWALVDRRRTPLASAPIGSVSALVLEKYTDHPELAGQLLRDTLEENFDLTLYVEPDGMVRSASPAPRAAQAPAGRLKLAKSYLSVGMKAKGKKMLLDIVKKYPKSKQADEARELLNKLRQPD